MEKCAFQFSTIFFASFLTLYLTQQQGYDPCEDVEEGELVRGPINCSHFIVCDGDDPYDDFCEDGMLFNAETQQCDDPDYVECGDDETNSEEEYGEDDEYNDDNDDGGEADDEDVESGEGDRDDDQTSEPVTRNGCPRNDDPSKVIFVPNSQTCSEYFLCYHGIPIAMQCTQSLHFNPSTNKCDFPRNVNCRLETDNNVMMPPRCDRDVYMEVYPHPTQCDYYYYCRKGYLSVQQCPFYFYFDRLTKTCRVRDGSIC